MKKSLFLIFFTILMFSTTVFCATDTITPTEENTLATVAAIDQNEILLASVALHKNVPVNIKQFAQMMISQHGANLTEIMMLAHQFNLATLSSPMAAQFTADGQAALLSLGALTGAEFNQTYVNAMATGHQSALNLIDTQLLKTATDPVLHQFMEATRTAVAMHLAHAKALQANLKK